MDPDSWRPAERYWIDKNGYHDPYRKADDHGGPVFLGRDELEAGRALERHYRDGRATLAQADLVVFTLGLTELWRHRQDHSGFYAVPGPDFFKPNLHEFHNLSYQDVVEHTRDAIHGLQRLRPGVRVLLAVSPIPLSISFRPELGPYVATSWSKSVPQAAVQELIRLEGVDYMPSFEIAGSNPAAHFAGDGRHVTDHCVETIMRAFEWLYTVRGGG